MNNEYKISGKDTEGNNWSNSFNVDDVGWIM